MRCLPQGEALCQVFFRRFIFPEMLKCYQIQIIFCSVVLNLFQESLLRNLAYLLYLSIFLWLKKNLYNFAYVALKYGNTVSLYNALDAVIRRRKYIDVCSI